MKSVSYLGIMAGILFSISLPVHSWGLEITTGMGMSILMITQCSNIASPAPEEQLHLSVKMEISTLTMDVDLYDFGCFTSAFSPYKSSEQKASTFTMNLEATSSTVVNPGDTVHYTITGQFTGGSSLGLGLWGVNLSSDFGSSGELVKASPGPEMDGFRKEFGVY